MYIQPMKIYVCYGTFKLPAMPGRPIGHVCGAAHQALVDAGYEPEVVRAYGFGPLPDALNFSKGRREVRRLTGNNWVPAVVLDSGEVIQGSQKIIDWAAANPAAVATS
jgi:hypothetical protein